MEKIKVWTSANTSDPNIYAYLVDFEKASGLQVNVNRPPFGVGVSGFDTYLIQGDGIQWFLEQCPAIRMLLPEWVLVRLGEIKIESSEDKLNHVLKRLEKVTTITEYQRGKNTPFDVLHEECLTLIKEIQTGVVIDRSLVHD